WRPQTLLFAGSNLPSLASFAMRSARVRTLRSPVRVFTPRRLEWMVMEGSLLVLLRSGDERVDAGRVGVAVVLLLPVARERLHGREGGLPLGGGRSGACEDHDQVARLDRREDGQLRVAQVLVGRPGELLVRFGVARDDDRVQVLRCEQRRVLEALRVRV